MKRSLYISLAGLILGLAFAGSALAVHTSPFSEAVLDQNPSFYYQMDTDPNNTAGTALPDTITGSNPLAGQGGGPLYTDINGSPLSGVTNGPNKSFFARQTSLQALD